MTRLVQNWTPEAVDETPVAPHRYTWGRKETEVFILGQGREFKKSVPYQPGEVVWVDRGDDTPVKARILMLFAELDHFGDYRAKFRVQFATAKGVWSKSWVYAWAGMIQRGYQLAGLAPDVDAGDGPLGRGASQPAAVAA